MNALDIADDVMERVGPGVPPTLTLLVVKATLEALRDRDVLDLKGRTE